MYWFGCILAFLILFNSEDVVNAFGGKFMSEFNSHNRVLVCALISLGSWFTLFIYFLDLIGHDNK